MKRSTNVCISPVNPGVVGGIGLAAVLLACGAASAQSADTTVKARQEANRRIVTQPIRSAGSVRPPVIDLEAMARERRPGQVLPGDGYASGAMPYAARRELETLTLPDSGRPIMPRTATPKAATQQAAPIRIAERVPSADVPGAPEQTAPAPTPAAHASVHEPDPPAAPVERVAQTAAPDSAMPLAPVSEPSSAMTSTPAEQAPAPTASAHPPVASIPIVSPPAPHSAPIAESAPTPVAAVGIDALLVDNLSAPLSTDSARVVVSGLGGVMSEAQWRTADSAWKQPRSDDALEGKIEVRAGINGEVTLTIDGQVQVTVSRLGRIVIERALEQNGASVPTIALARGAIDIRPAEGAPVNGAILARVRTPDQAFGIRNGAFGNNAVRVEYDAFTGTRRRASNP